MLINNIKNITVILIPNSYFLIKMILGDGRMDSPGYCAQYCTYVFMDNQSKQILTCQTIDKREVDLKSTNMEAKGFVNGLEELKKKKINVVEVATDAHLTISSIMSMSLIHTITFLYFVWWISVLFEIYFEVQFELYVLYCNVKCVYKL